MLRIEKWGRTDVLTEDLPGTRETGGEGRGGEGRGKKPPKQHWLGKGVSATIPRSLCDSTPKPFSHFCNCDKHVFLA